MTEVSVAKKQRRAKGQATPITVKGANVGSLRPLISITNENRHLVPLRVEHTFSAQWLESGMKTAYTRK